MSERIEPALSESEWEQGCFYIGHNRFAGDNVDWTGHGFGGCPEEVWWDKRRHALAALALRGMPYGFSHEDVEALRILAQREGDWQLSDVAQGLADRIEALLPPRSTKT